MKWHPDQPLPNLFLAGVPKCGTSTLYRWLGQHPDIFMCPTKEPHFFSDPRSFARIHPFWRLKRTPRDPRRPPTRAEYLDEFGDAGSESIIGEASPYVYSKSALRAIRVFNPDARVVILVRPPLEVIRSLHQYNVFTGIEPLVKLADALAAEPDRATGITPRDVNDLDQLLYKRRANYVNDIENCIEIFGRGAVHIIRLEDLAAHPRAAFLSCLQFLNVDEAFRADVRRRNTTREWRFPSLTRLVFSQNMKVRRFRNAVFPPVLRQSVYRTISVVASRKGSKPQIPADLAQTLADEFAGDVCRLEKMLQCSLDHWPERTGGQTAMETAR